MLTLEQFIAKYNGQKGVGNTPQNKGQCVGLVSIWWDEFGTPHIWGDAKDLPENIDKNFYEYILNTPTGIPARGDVIVWGAGFLGSAIGHTAIATGGAGTDVNKFEVFEQNMPIGGACRLHLYPNYNSVRGWLRFKPQEPMATITQKELDKIIADRNKNWNLYQAELLTNRDILSKNVQLQGKLDASNNKLSQIKTLVG